MCLGFSTRYDQVDDFVNVSYSDIEQAELDEFQYLLKKVFLINFSSYNDHVNYQESSWKRSCIHKGLISNIIFVIIFALGVVLVEVQFPLEGPRGFTTNDNNYTKCINNTPVCFVSRAIRSIGLFGFTGMLHNYYLIIIIS